ncbi:hypothetical protein D3C80_1925370 [compost metagenome]
MDIRYLQTRQLSQLQERLLHRRGEPVLRIKEQEGLNLVTYFRLGANKLGVVHKHVRLSVA